MLSGADQEVLTQLTRWMSAGMSCWLATVIKTWGSSPRPIGALFCCNEAGQTAGSLSGGCIEEDLLEKLQRGEIAKTAPQILVYGATPEETERLGLPCGGQLHLLIEPQVDQQRLAQFQQIADRLTARECMQRRVKLSTGEMEITEEERFSPLELVGDFDALTQGDGVGVGGDVGESGERFMVQTLGPRYQLFLIGAGPVSIYLAQMAQMLDYQVLVCDPREEVIADWPVAGAQLICDMPDDAIRRAATDNFSAIIALTHDPRIDDMGLMEALKTDAFFVGAMGSARTSAKRRERLLQLGLSQAEVARLHAPVGLPIGSKTPAEIALAILSQLKALRAIAQVSDRPERADRHETSESPETLETRGKVLAADFRQHVPRAD